MYDVHACNNSDSAVSFPSSLANFDTQAPQSHPSNECAEFHFQFILYHCEALFSHCNAISLSLSTVSLPTRGELLIFFQLLLNRDASWTEKKRKKWKVWRKSKVGNRAYIDLIAFVFLFLLSLDLIKQHNKHAREINRKRLCNDDETSAEHHVLICMRLTTEIKEWNISHDAKEIMNNDWYCMVMMTLKTLL